MPQERWSFLIVAAGSGSRMGGDPKQFRRLASMPLWQWSAAVAERLWEKGRVAEVVLVVPSEYRESIEAQCTMKIPARVAEGGETRSESVIKGLEICRGSHVLVHDGARPFITEDLCLRLIEKAEDCGSAVPLLASVDSLKKRTEEEFVSVDRKEYFRTQTPQAFDREQLLDSLRLYGRPGTDEAEAWLASGRGLGHVEGEERNFKITTPFDWSVAVSMAGAGSEKRTGHGYDVHRLVQGRKLILAGIEIKNAGLGLLGHSDADIVLHTVMDAMLGAAGEPDIGTLFPADDEKWKDAAGTDMLVMVVNIIRSGGWRIDWVDVTLEAQSPRLGHMIPEFIANVALYLTEPDGALNFNMKVKSGEHCGCVGRNECMVCHGVATLSRIQ